MDRRARISRSSTGRSVHPRRRRHTRSDPQDRRSRELRHRPHRADSQHTGRSSSACRGRNRHPPRRFPARIALHRMGTHARIVRSSAGRSGHRRIVRHMRIAPWRRRIGEPRHTSIWPDTRPHTGHSRSARRDGSPHLPRRFPARIAHHHMDRRARIGRSSSGRSDHRRRSATSSCRRHRSGARHCKRIRLRDKTRGPDSESRNSRSCRCRGRAAGTNRRVFSHCIRRPPHRRFRQAHTRARRCRSGEDRSARSTRMRSARPCTTTKAHRHSRRLRSFRDRSSGRGARHRNPPVSALVHHAAPNHSPRRSSKAGASSASHFDDEAQARLRPFMMPWHHPSAACGITA